MPRVISLHLPSWSTDRWRRSQGRDAPPAETPIVMIGRVGTRRIVTAANAAALAAGAWIGMPATQAGAVIEQLRMVLQQPEADAQALEALACRAVRRFSPIVALDPPDGLRIEATGVSHLFGGEAAMLNQLVAGLQAAGIAANAAMAASYGAAHALARFGPPLAISEDSQSLLGLPLAALRLPEAMRETLQTLGFETIGALIAAPRAPLALRFGAPLLRRLDQALGKQAEPCRPVPLPDMVRVDYPFAEPISTPEALLHLIGLLARDVSALLEARQLGARRGDLLFHRVDDSVTAIRIGLSKPERGAKAIARLLAERLPTIDPGFGIEKMTLAIPWAEPLDYRQAHCAFGEKPRPDLSSLADSLANRLGEGCVYRLAPVESDVPERSVVRVSPLAAASPLPWPTKRQPCRLFAYPQPIETIALLPDHPPRQFIWQKEHYVVRHADGPERIFGEWWKRFREVEAVRDYFEVEVEDGGRYWLYRSGDGVDPSSGSGKWFLHGIFQ